LAKPEQEARLPRTGLRPIESGSIERNAQAGGAETRILEQGPKLALGEESGKQSGDVPQGVG